MTDIFFSYSGADRERVRPIRDALVAQGFEVFWDQQVPSGMDWDVWIRQHLTKSKCAMAFWSATSVSSDHVRHEATVAKQQGKLISVLLEPLTAEQFPLGLYAQQAANLSGWNGDFSHDEWRKFRREFEAKLTPLWVRRQIDEAEAELVGERARREGAERRDRVLQAQIAKEAEAQQHLKQERDKALDQVAAQAETQQALTRERDSALEKIVGLKATVEGLTQAQADAEARTAELSQHLIKVRQSKAQEIARSIGATLSPLVIAAAVATAGFWTYQLIWSAPQSLPPVTSESAQEAEQQRQAKIADLEAKLKDAEGEQQRLSTEVQRQTKAAADFETKLKATEAEQQRLKEEVQRQAKAAADAETKLKATEAEQQRLKEEVQRQAKAAADAETKRKAAEDEQQRQAKVAAVANSKLKAAEAEQQRLAGLLKAEQERREKAEADPKGLFTIKENTRAVAASLATYSRNVVSRAACEEMCMQETTCKIFTYNKSLRQCFRYTRADFESNDAYDSGIRIEQTTPSADIKVAPPPSAATQVSSTGLFTIRINTDASGYEAAGRISVASIGV